MKKPIIFSTPMVKAILDGRKTQTRRVIKPQPQRHFEVCDMPGNFHLFDVEWGLGRIYPKYQIGDVLWVRETWADLRGMGFGNDPITDNPWNFAYKADIKEGSDSDRIRKEYGVKWKPSIHMPREAARMFLEVKDVSVERLSSISDSDVLAEGFQSKEAFFLLWNKLNYSRGFGVGTNPFVWRIKFKEVKEQNGRED